jgi:hypothetical protein
MTSNSTTKNTILNDCKSSGALAITKLQQETLPFDLIVLLKKFTAQFPEVASFYSTRTALPLATIDLFIQCRKLLLSLCLLLLHCFPSQLELLVKLKGKL